jgi:DNA repair protein RadA/Sms
VVVVDSIQTISLSAITSSAGSVTQVRECTQLLINACKGSEIPLFIVGHVNKDGGIAGPKVLEHMVDTVLYFEGDRNLSYRILRAIKNRFGSTNEIGVFEMSGGGLLEVENPSEALLSGRPTDVSGTCITCMMEGTRPILVEVQALIAKTSFGNPRRVPTGFDFNRTALLIAVLEKRGGYFMGNLDVFINAAGGMRIDDPGADLAVALCMVSNLLDKPVDSKLLALGEIGLAGEVRPVGLAQQRVGEAYRLGFTTFILPKSSLRTIDQGQYPGAVFHGVSSIGEAFTGLRMGRR